MSRRSGLLALGRGLVRTGATRALVLVPSWALVLVPVLALAFGLASWDEEAALVLRPVELIDPAPEDPFDLDPLLAPGSIRSEGSRPAGGPATDARSVEDDRTGELTVELVGGDVVTVLLADTPALALLDDDIAFVELAEESIDLRFAAYAILTDSGRAAYRPFAAQHANDHLLVEIAGRPVDLFRPLGWTRGSRIGVFADERARTRFLETLPFDSH